MEFGGAQSAIELFLEEAGAAGLGWRDQGGSTPLYVACEDGNCCAVTTLLRRGADTGAQDHSGNFPLHLALVSC